MANRMIAYGYGIQNNAIVVIAQEAETVRGIFKDYLDGSPLKKIAVDLEERGIPFYEDICVWNKAKILRVIENDKYIGANGYHAIIDRETYRLANEKKNEKGYTANAPDAMVEYIKTSLVCSRCGERLYKKGCIGDSDMWRCPNKCGSTISKVKALEIFERIVVAAKDNQELLAVSEDEPHYVKTQELCATQMKSADKSMTDSRALRR